MHGIHIIFYECRLNKYNESFIFRKSMVETITDYWYENKPSIQTHITIYAIIQSYLSDNVVLNKEESRTFYNLFLDKNATFLYSKHTKEEQRESSGEY